MSLTVEIDGGEGGVAPCGGSLQGSPRNRVKFLCSHGGKILPRPADGQLKYVGGETRVISVPRDICFSELVKKLTYLIDGEMLLKYQLMPEDLDALVSVKSDEDLRHMFEEYDRHEASGYPRLRTFLFPPNPVVIENQLGSIDRYTLEQRYINSINDIIHPMPPSFKPPPINVGHATFSISSACSSPRSPTPESCPTDGSHHENYISNNFNSARNSINRIHSYPSMQSLNGQPSHNGSPQTHQYHYHYYQQPFRHPQQQQQHHPAYQPQKPPLDPHPHRSHGPERLLKVRSVGQAESSRYQVDHIPIYQYSPTRQSREGSLCCNKCSHYDDYVIYSNGRTRQSREGSLCCNKCSHYDDYVTCGNGRLEPAGSVPGSPSLPRSPHQGSVPGSPLLPRSPRQGYGSKPWD